MYESAAILIVLQLVSEADEGPCDGAENTYTQGRLALSGVSIVAPLTLPDLSQGLGEARLVVHVTIDSSVGVVRLTSISTGSKSSSASKATHLQGSFHTCSEYLGTEDAQASTCSTAQHGTSQDRTAQQAALDFRDLNTSSGQSVGELDVKVAPPHSTPYFVTTLYAFHHTLPFSLYPTPFTISCTLSRFFTHGFYLSSVCNLSLKVQGQSVGDLDRTVRPSLQYPLRYARL